MIIIIDNVIVTPLFHAHLLYISGCLARLPSRTSQEACPAAARQWQRQRNDVESLTLFCLGFLQLLFIIR